MIEVKYVLLVKFSIDKINQEKKYMKFFNLVF